MKLRNPEGFTLTEVLVVLLITGLIFSVLTVVLFSSTNNSLSLLSRAEELKRDSTLMWNLQRKILSSQEILLEKDRLHMVTAAGDFYEGVVKCSYILKNGSLYYYEFPYPYGDLRFFEENKLIFLGNFDNFKIIAYQNQQSHQEFRGMPDYFQIEIKGRIFIVKTK